MDFDLDGKLAALEIPRTKALQPLFEAVVNALQAVEARRSREPKRASPGNIEIIAQRGELLEGLDGKGRIDGFTVVDDGIGFDDTNLGSFFTAYSRHKVKIGGKGIGRFTFLKVFRRTQIDSHFPLNGGMVSRTFSLPDTLQRPNDAPKPSGASSNRTSVELTGMKEPWRSACDDRLDDIAISLIGHCIPYFMNPQCPRIKLHDEDEQIDLQDLFRRNFQKQAKPRPFVVSGENFTLTGFRLWNNRAEAKHKLVYAANHRSVQSETLSRVLPSIGDHHLPGDDGKKFVYMGFIEGDYLNAHTSPERLRLEIPSGDDEDAQDLPGMPSLRAIRAQAVEEVKADLAPFLDHVAQQIIERVQRFVNEQAPELRPMLRYLDRFVHEIPLDASQARINEVLRRHQFDEEQEIRRHGDKLLTQLKAKSARPADYEARLNEWLERSNELGKSALARYVIHRKVMLDFLDASLRVDRTTGEYKLEEVVHQIIYPMRATSLDVDYDQQNLWMIDERLAFHEFLISDKPLTSSKELDSHSKLRPDLFVFQSALSFKEDKDVLDSIVVVEFKKPGRDDYTENDNPIVQAFALIKDIREGRAKKEGRPIEVRSPEIPAWIYVVCDLTDKLRSIAEGRSFLRTSDGRGLYAYFAQLKTYCEIIPYQKLVSDARKRNRILFESLNLPS